MPHIHEVLDADRHFIIDSCTGELVNYTPEKNNVRQFAHNSERLTFELPRFIEGHDMSTCNIVEVHFINVDAATGTKNPGLYFVKDLALAANNGGDETVKCSWLISKEATQLAGLLLFRLSFICSNNGNIDYLWPTAIYHGFRVSDGINNTAYVVDTYPDVLADFNDRLHALEASGGRSGPVYVAGEEPPEDTSVIWVKTNAECDDDGMEQLAALIETDMLPAVCDSNGAILTDATGNIIMRY